MKAKNLKFLLVFFAISLLFPIVIQAQSSTTIAEMTKEDVLNLSYDELLALSLDDLMYLSEKLNVTIDDLLNTKLLISKKELPIREQPSIISVITNEEIMASGATNFMDILKMIPGINFGFDTEGVIGIIIRGNWANEGKVLLMIDGMEVNERFYCSLQFGNHYPIEQIKRIEIIRGPGSAIYGGSAELGVINVITYDGDELNGAKITPSYSLLEESFGLKSGSLSLGIKHNNLNISLHTYISNRNLSEENFSTIGDTTISLLSENSLTKEKWINLGISYKNVYGRFIFDDYNTTAYDGGAYLNQFSSYFSEIGSNFKINNKITISAKLNYKQQRPWYSIGYYYNKTIIRAVPSLIINYDITPKLNMLTGVEYSYDYSILLNEVEDEPAYFYNGKKTIGFQNFAIFSQWLFTTKLANITLGGRFENHSLYGSAFAPRIGFNKVVNKFHFKILYSYAYRTPYIGNIRFNQNLKPETTTVAEVEIGYKINNNMFITTNIYDIQMNKVIAYYDSVSVYGEDLTDDMVVWGYDNFGKSGTSGAEIEFTAKYNKFSNTTNFSYYNARNNNEIGMYSVPEDSSMLLGSSKFKFTSKIAYNFTEQFSISLSFMALSDCYAQNGFEEETLVPIVEKVEQGAHISMYFLYKNLFINGLNFGLGINNITNNDLKYITPYLGVASYYPYSNREIFLKLSYKINF